MHFDGIFSTAPSGFKQVYIIHGKYKWNIIPCAFVLFSGKSEAVYKQMILELKNGALLHVINLDFERGAINAFV